MAVQLPWSNPKAIDTENPGFPVTGLWSNPGYVSTIRAEVVWNMVGEDGLFVPCEMAVVST